MHLLPIGHKATRIITMKTNGTSTHGSKDGLDITTRTTNTSGRHHNNHQPRKKRRESRHESRFADPNDSDSDPPDRIFATVASSARSLGTIESVRSIASASEKDAESSNGQDPQKYVGEEDADDNDADPRKMVVVRYFLDRPGYGFHNSAARFWFDPPEVCMSRHVHTFLKEQGIALDGLLIEIYLDKFQAFMLLEACEANLIQWNFRGTNIHDPGVLNVRLTDLACRVALRLYV